MKIEKILAGIDLGTDTEKVLAYATFFAKDFGASLHVLHVIDFLVTPPAYLAQYLEEEKRNAEETFAGWKGKLEKAGISAVMEVVVGRLHESFEAAVRRVNAGMLVIGFQSHALRRSSSERLIKGLEMPILIVRGEKAGAARIGSVRVENILCPVDFSGISGKALQEIGRAHV
jgi:nucleotide-binding universal stress UspA family protein